MKKILSTTLFLLLTTLGFTQNYSITSGKEHLMDEDFKTSISFAEDEKYIYSYSIFEKGHMNYFITKQEKGTLKKIWAYDTKFIDFDIPFYQKKVFNFIPIFTGKKVLLFDKIYDKKSKEVCLMLKTVTVEGKLEKTWTKITSLESDPFGVVGRNFYCSISPDFSQLIIVSQFAWDKKPQITAINRYNPATMEKIVGDINLPSNYKAGDVSNYNFNVDNRGSITYIMKFWNKQTDDNMSYAFSFVDKRNAKPMINELVIAPKWEMGDCMAKQAENGNIIYAGTFKDVPVKKSKLELKAGAFFFSVDSTGKLISNEFKYFSEEVEKKLYYEVGGNVGKPAAKKFFRIKQIIEINGDYYMIANNSYSLMDGAIENPIEREFIVSKFQANGKMEWIKSFPKFTRGDLNGFNLMVHNNKFYLFYLEHPKNVKKKEKGLNDYDPEDYNCIYNNHGSVVVGLEISPDGTAVRNTVEDADKDWFFISASPNTTLEKGNSLLIKMIKGKNERFDVLKIN
jgi:hypothetical protein